VIGRLLTAREVAGLFGFSVDTVLRWTREGKLRGIRVSGTRHGRLRYLEDDLEALLGERATTAAPVREAPTPHSGTAVARVSFPVPTPSPRSVAASTEEDLPMPPANTGYFYELADGTWGVQYRLADGTRKRRSGFKNKTAAAPGTVTTSSTASAPSARASSRCAN
jgi:excisionase family DNA binding protein